MQFPISEVAISALSQEMIAGFVANPEVFPHTPVVPEALAARLADYVAKRNAAVTAQALAQQATSAKDAALAALIDDMKTDLRHAETITHGRDEQLKLIGWSARRPRTKTAVPGQPGSLQIPGQGEGWLKLTWTAPATGGKVTAYKIQCRRRTDGTYKDIATALEPAAGLVEQPRGTELEYRVVAVNKSGEGPPSNTVMVVL